MVINFEHLVARRVPDDKSAARHFLDAIASYLRSRGKPSGAISAYEIRDVAERVLCDPEGATPEESELCSALLPLSGRWSQPRRVTHGIPEPPFSLPTARQIGNYLRDLCKKRVAEGRMQPTGNPYKMRRGIRYWVIQ